MCVGGGGTFFLSFLLLGHFLVVLHPLSVLLLMLSLGFFFCSFFFCWALKSKHESVVFLKLHISVKQQQNQTANINNERSHFGQKTKAAMMVPVSWLCLEQKTNVVMMVPVS